MTVYIGLGSNLGDRHHNLVVGSRMLAADSCFLWLRQASMYTSAAMGPRAGDEFLNTAVAGVWQDDPETLLDLCLHVESALGRTRPFPNAPRTLDLDILWIEDQAVRTPRLEVPHARLTERAFALVPLVELAPELVWPGTRRPLSSYLTPAILAQDISETRKLHARMESACV